MEMELGRRTLSASPPKLYRADRCARAGLIWPGRGSLLAALFLVVLERGEKWGGAHSLGMNSKLKGLEGGVTYNP